MTIQDELKNYKNEREKNLKLIRLSNKEIIDRFYKSDDSTIYNLYMQAIHQLINIQLLYLDEIEDILNKYGLVKQSLKQSLNSCKNHFDLMERDMRRQWMGQEKEQADFFNDEFDMIYRVLTDYFIKGTTITTENKNEESND